MLGLDSLATAGNQRDESIDFGKAVLGGQVSNFRRVLTRGKGEPANAPCLSVVYISKHAQRCELLVNKD